MAIPNEYTACETYRGFIISIRHGVYYAHNADGTVTALRFTNTRAEMRAQIDGVLV